MYTVILLLLVLNIQVSHLYIVSSDASARTSVDDHFRTEMIVNIKSASAARIQLQDVRLGNKHIELDVNLCR